MALLRSNFPLTAVPGQTDYNKTFYDALDDMGNPQYDKYANVIIDPNKAHFMEVAIGDLPYLAARPTATADYVATALAELGSVAFTISEFGLRFDSQDHQWDTLPADVRAGLPTQMAWTAAATLEQKAASIYDYAFTAGHGGYDSKALCADDHPITGGTNDNLLTAALSGTSLAVARAQYRKLLTSAGKVSNRGFPRYLVVPADLEHTARQILSASWAVTEGVSHGSNGGDGNPNQGSLELLVSDYMASSTDWFVVGDPARNPRGALVVLQRVPTFESGRDGRTGTQWGHASLCVGVGFGSYNWIVGANV